MLYVKLLSACRASIFTTAAMISIAGMTIQRDWYYTGGNNNTTNEIDGYQFDYN